MTDNKIYDLPKTETISIFNENEWNKDLTPEEVLKSDELGELIYRDKVLHGPLYGPGNNMSQEDQKNVTKGTVGALGGIGIAALSIVCPPAGAMTAIVVGGAGATAKVASNFVPSDSNAHEILDFAGDSYMAASAIGSSPSNAREFKNIAIGKKIVK